MRGGSSSLFGPFSLSCTVHPPQVAHALDATQQKGQELADAVESALTGKK